MLTKRVVLKYILIHLAELALVGAGLIVLVYVVDLAVWLAATIFVLWIVKDAALFPKVWKAYARDEADPLRMLIGTEATVTDALDPVGYVRANGELWRAESRDAGQRAKKGAVVRVVDIRGMTLIVTLPDGGDR
jgi:membrane protein implicated in regulation of membrane protease activity